MDEQEFNKQLGDRIRDARMEAGLTQEQLAARVRMSRGSVANIELGDQAPPPYRLALIAQALRTEVAELVPSLDASTSSADIMRDLVGREDIARVVERLQGRARRTAADG
jgi:transcriptional regulator with XRE-family HTH domain